MSKEINHLRNTLIKGEQSGTASYGCESFRKERCAAPTNKNPKYTLDSLLKTCDCNAPQNHELEYWDKVKPVGREGND